MFIYAVGAVEQTMRKAQVTLFIVLGIILLLSTAILVYTLQGRISEPQLTLPQTVRGALNAVHACQDGVIATAIRLQALQGGALAPRPSATAMPLAIGLAITDGTILLPRRTDMEDDLAENLPLHLAGCAEDLLEDAQRDGVSLENAPAIINASIGDDEILLQLDQPITLAWSGGSVRDRPRAIRIPSPLGALRDTAEEIVLRALAEPDLIDTDFLFSMPYDAAVIGLYGSAAIIAITDSAAEDPLTFNIALPLPERQREPSIRWTQLDDPLLIRAGTPFSSRIAADGEGMRYESDLPWLRIDPASGTVTARVDESYAGRHLATLTATDTEGESVSATIEVIVQ